MSFCLVEGEGGVRDARRGGSVLSKILRRGGVFKEGEGPGGCLQRIGEFGVGGGNILFCTRNVNQAEKQAFLSPLRSNSLSVVFLVREGPLVAWNPNFDDQF